MRDDRVGVGFVRRVADRAEFIDFLALRHDNQPAGVLAGRPFDADAPGCNARFIRFGEFFARFFLIAFDIAVCRRLCDGRNRPCAEDVVFAEQLDRVLMGFGLVFARKVQVDIRVLVAVETEEGRKRDVVAVFNHMGAAVRTILVGHVRPAVAFGVEL